MTKITLLFCLFSSILWSQNITGTLYDAEASVSGAKIMNITSKSITTSDGNGQFEIYAQETDTLIFSSLFHHPKKIIVARTFFDGPQVFELKKILNELDEVEVRGAVTPEELDDEKVTKQVKNQFQTDIEKNPHLYRRPNAARGPIDILEIGRRVAKLFERKTPREKNSDEETLMTSEELTALFKTDDFFNDEFLLLNLNITKDYKYLFLDYCETKQMSSTLLHPENKIFLVDKFLEYSQEFTQILKESQKQ